MQLMASSTWPLACSQRAPRSRHSLACTGSVFPGRTLADSWELNWPFAWFPYALIHGLNPWYTHAQWAPTGLNVASATSFPLLAMVFAPVTWIWGPIVSANLASLGATVVTGWATYLLCRYVSKDRAAALIGGATVGFGTYLIVQMWAGHTLLTVFFCPQFAALAVLPIALFDPTTWILSPLPATYKA